MTREEILNMEVGIKLDDLVTTYITGDFRNYSEDIECGWNLLKIGIQGSFTKRKDFYKILQDVATYMMDIEIYTKGQRIMYPDVFTTLRDRFPEAVCKTVLIMYFEGEK